MSLHTFLKFWTKGNFGIPDKQFTRYEVLDIRDLQTKKL